MKTNIQGCITFVEFKNKYSTSEYSHYVAYCAGFLEMRIKYSQINIVK